MLFLKLDIVDLDASGRGVNVRANAETPCGSADLNGLQDAPAPVADRADAA